MRRLILILLLAFVAHEATAQHFNPDDYIYPMREAQQLYSANFGEMRPNHFHSGIDLKSDGVEGKPVVAVADGFVSRITVSPGGFGRAIYITLHNGFTAVYGHLACFNDEIESYVRDQRMRKQSNRVDLSIPRDRFPVSQGEVVAYSGNSGGSYGPHLHYELRQTLTQRTLNIVRLGALRPTDAIAPYILRIHYIETDTVRGVPVHRNPASYEAARINSTSFRLLRRTPIPIGRNGHFVVELTDRRNGVSNSFGIYRATLRLDDKPHFEYRIDGFTFNRSRDCNAVTYYPLQLTSNNELIRLAAIDGACRDFCPIAVEQGTISAAPGELRTLRIEIEDDCGNTSHMDFKVQGRTPWQAQDDPQNEVCDRRQNSVFVTEGAKLTVPPGALFESILLRIRRSDTHPTHNPSLVLLSPAYRLLHRTIPLKKSVEVSINADIPAPLRSHAALGLITTKGGIAYVGGRYADGAVTAHTTSTGEMLVVADTVPPTIKPLFTPGTPLTSTSTITFRISDNFSGIASCELHMDGQWVLCDRYPVKGTAVHTFDTPATGGRHTARLIVRDGCNNKTEWIGDFVR